MTPLYHIQLLLICFEFAAILVSVQGNTSPTESRYRHNNRIQGGPGVVTSALPVDVLREADIPMHFDYRNIYGRSYVVPTYNQYVPEECGSCWAHASAAALSDRIKRLRNASFPDIEISRQVILNCLSGWAGPRNGCCTCDGGDPYQAYAYIHQHGVPDETCAAYVAAVQSCTREHTCKGTNGAALPKNGYTKYSVSEFGAYFCGNSTTKDMADYGFKVPRCEEKYGKQVLPRMELVMRSEIFARGPIACCMAVSDAFVNLRSHDVYSESSSRYYCDHVVSISGWGQTAIGKKYWIVRNSFGSFWGENGWFRIERGSNNAGIEQYCAWANPRDDWTAAQSTTLVV